MMHQSHGKHAVLGIFLLVNMSWVYLEGVKRMSDYPSQEREVCFIAYCCDLGSRGCSENNSTAIFGYPYKVKKKEEENTVNFISILLDSIKYLKRVWIDFILFPSSLHSHPFVKVRLDSIFCSSLPSQYVKRTHEFGLVELSISHEALSNMYVCLVMVIVICYTNVIFV